MHPTKLKIYIDGAAQGNPGPAGIGLVVCNESGRILENISEYIGENTNNVAEYMALIYALQEGLIRKVQAIQINTDSELLVKQLNKEYKVKDSKLKPLYRQASHLLRGFGEVEVIHIQRDRNRGADRLAAKAIKDFRRDRPNSKATKFSLKNPEQGLPKEFLF